MINVDDVIKEINQEIKVYTKYEPKLVEQPGDKLLKGNKPRISKEQVPYLVIPAIVIAILVYFKPDFLYDNEHTEDVKKVSVQKTTITVFAMSGVAIAVYYFYIQNLF